MLEIIMFIWGIVVLSTGKFSSGKGVVIGGRARMIGLVLIAPVPLALVGGLMMGAAGYVPTGFVGPHTAVEAVLVFSAWGIANLMGRNWSREVTKEDEAASAAEAARVAREREEAQAHTTEATKTITAAIKQKAEQLTALRQELAPLKSHRRKVLVLSMIGCALITGAPTFIVFSQAGLFATLVGIGLGFLATRLFFVVNSAQRGVSARLRSEERILGEIETIRQKAEQRP